MKKKLKFILAQLDFLVGDIEGNTEKIISHALFAKEEQAQLIIFPELALTGYPPEDLLFRDGLYERCHIALNKIRQEINGIDILLGLPVKEKKNTLTPLPLLATDK